jgi:hypothetical protein
MTQQPDEWNKDNLWLVHKDEVIKKILNKQEEQTTKFVSCKQKQAVRED